MRANHALLLSINKQNLISTTFSWLSYERDEDLEYRRGFCYGRMANPTRSRLEETLADLEGGTSALAFSSGLAAAAAIFQALPLGHIIIPDDLYHGTNFVSYHSN